MPLEYGSQISLLPVSITAVQGESALSPHPPTLYDPIWNLSRTAMR